MSKVIHFPTEEQAHDGRVTQQESYIIPFVLRLPAQGYLGKSRAPGHRVRVWDRYHSAVSGGVVVYCCCKKCFSLRPCTPKTEGRHTRLGTWKLLLSHSTHNHGERLYGGTSSHHASCSGRVLQIERQIPNFATFHPRRLLSFGHYMAATST